MSHTHLFGAAASQRQFHVIAGLAVAVPGAGRRAVEVGVDNAVEGLLEVDVDLHLSLAAVEVCTAAVQIDDVAQLVQLHDFTIQPAAREEYVRWVGKR